jgi:hypothetical protein
VGPLREGTQAKLLAKGWLSRKVAVEAPVETVIEFRGWELSPAVYVDGRLAARQPIQAEGIEFTLNVDDKALPVVVHHRPTLWATVAEFRIEIDGKIVYSEERWPAVKYCAALGGVAGSLFGIMLSILFIRSNPKSYVLPEIALAALFAFLGFVVGASLGAGGAWITRDLRSKRS